MIKPLGDKVLIKINESKEKTKNGIILSNLEKENSQNGKVIAVGIGGNVNGKNIEMFVKENDNVIINKYSGTEIKFEDEEYWIVNQSDILAIID